MKEINEETLKQALDMMADTLCKGRQWFDTHSLDTPKDIIEEVLGYYFDDVEGFVCSRDKASYTANMILKSIKNKETYPLKMTYRESKCADRFDEEELDKVCYWCPRTLGTTEDAYMIFSRLIDPRCSMATINSKKLEIANGHSLPSLDEMNSHMDPKLFISIFRIVMSDDSFITLCYNKTPDKNDGEYMIEAIYRGKTFFGSDKLEHFERAKDSILHFILYENLKVDHTEWEEHS